MRAAMVAERRWRRDKWQMLIRSIFHLDLFVVFCLTVLVRGWLAGWLDFGCLSVGVFRLSYLVEGQYWQYHM